MTTLARKNAQNVSFQESPALATARRLQAAADLFNRELFNNQLPSTMLRLQNKKGCNGFYSPNKFIDADGRQLDCITLNSTTAIDRPLIELLSTLVHEQCHQYVCEVVNHKAATGGHGPEWRNVMNNLGLPPIRVGATWRGPATHSIDPDGLFARCFRTHASELEAMSWQELAMDQAGVVRRVSTKSALNAPAAVRRHGLGLQQN
ncbi:SprT-like family protein [Synechococcus sp. MIT S9509]|uniref:SprT-like domain-containing protein n=1 Tax=unclassified Synechococcus TaxID=2626047 RepID=UPI0007BC0338|nr:MULTISPECIES: SprT-like domain-containing protein [unclassified Synechococcus]KZR86520.1 SprT-like family protein [Synechococcus sp. MIT S9504]KZR92540.1 SprT-like family protein [Synechococcus sp. MIT S9509]